MTRRSQILPAAGEPACGPIPSLVKAAQLAAVALGALLLATGVAPAGAAETEPEVAAGAAEAKEEEKEKDDKNPVTAHYKKGLIISSADGNFAAKINWRAQMRYTDLTSEDLFGIDDEIDEADGFLIRRARFKLKGHAYRPWLKYYLEYGIAASVLLTWEFNLEPMDQVGAKIGQYKVLYNRERVDSSGKQQFVDRSIVNAPFTIDRQQGAAAVGHLFKGSRGDSKYAVGIYTGTGRGGGLDDDHRPMYVARWQWNFLKRDLPFSQSDIDTHEKAAASFALAATSNVSRFTLFSSAGGGQLPGFAPGESGQYKLEQWMAEYAHMYKGFSFQGEYHFKRIDDRLNDQITDLDGFYAQAGYFFHNAFPSFPKPLEFAVRVAAVYSDGAVELPVDREATLAMNWFFSGHDNKLTGDVSRLKSKDDLAGVEDSGWRARIQWDITF